MPPSPDSTETPQPDPGDLPLDERFGFGANWKNFLRHLDDARMAEARDSLKQMLGRTSLAGLEFLDIGCGSGLFSLAARQLGARVRGFDFDPDSVQCARHLKERFFPDSGDWRIERGSVLDQEYIASLGEFDIVYAWGVLHHTGDLWRALDNAATRVAIGGSLFIALYNDQGALSTFWKRVKQLYGSGWAGRALVVTIFVPLYATVAVLKGLVRHRNPLGYINTYKNQRGMSVYHDWIDWLGGLPFEVASPGDVLDFLASRGFRLQRLTTTNASGCNQFVFLRESGN
ncbi:MAG: class I SAM-dependent methyltransferase [Gammaproteobacteria bacterium]|nr:class I SAM-dependent methyltransferase [Gammaproteobacteria bacterium]